MAHAPDPTHNRAVLSPNLSPSNPSLIRNVVLVGPTGSGKTTLAESMLFVAGAIPRAGNVAEGTTVTDYDDAARRQERSVSLTVAPLMWNDIKVNVLDTPGYADFVGDLRAGLRAADAALFVVSALDGVDSVTAMLWQECVAVSMPRAIVVTHIDSGRADFDEMVAICQRVFGEGVLPLFLPLADDAGTPVALLDLLGARIIDHTDGARSEREPDAEHLTLTLDARTELIEGIITESEDETLMDRFLDGETLDETTLVADLERAVARGSFFPVLLTATTPLGLGVSELLDVITRGFPSPAEHPIPPVTSPLGHSVDPLICNPDGPLLAEVIKTASDPYVGRLSLARVFSGTLTSDMTVHVAGHFHRTPEHHSDERVGALSSPFGAQLRPVTHATAGDIVVVSKLQHAETGDTLSNVEHPLLMEGWVMPDPLLPVAIVAHSTSDDDRLGQALTRVVAEDPSARLEHNAETGQLVLWCLGEAHAEVVLDRLRVRHGVAIDAVPLRLSLRETFTETATGVGRLVKQSGGHGQYAVVTLKVEPRPTGAGYEFVDQVVGGAIPRQFIASVEKGVRTQMEQGLLGGYPVVDIRVTVVDGKAHAVDSSDMAFQHAAALALKDAAASSSIAMLEPVDAVTVSVADEYVGAIMGDLSGRRGRVLGSVSDGSGRTEIQAEAPQSELTRYAIDVRALSHGTGTLSRSMRGYEQIPSNRASALLAAH